MLCSNRVRNLRHLGTKLRDWAASSLLCRQEPATTLGQHCPQMTQRPSSPECLSFIPDIIYGGAANSLSIFLPCPTAIDLPPSPLLSFKLLAAAAVRRRRNSFPSSVSAPPPPLKTQQEIRPNRTEHGATEGKYL